MIFLHGLALAVYEFQRYLKYRDDQRQEMQKREEDQQAAETYAAAAVEKAEAATAAADAGYAAWKEAMIFAALEAERVSAYSSKNAGSPETLEVKRLEAEALEKAHNYAALEEKRAAAALALERVQSAAAGTDFSSGENAAAAVAAPKADIVRAKQDKPKKKGIFGGMKTGFML
ncbi:uncharacterized protein LOC124253244 [Haliotis rubra]|uniref:uncharacterized protein LOC124253244 n=1 Tax=Haliotis rubra TaxID=36100 RepID=UPI001EE5CBE6|nr:uncharacterized protein LOC124253244 [Haliotis rubra]